MCIFINKANQPNKETLTKDAGRKLTTTDHTTNSKHHHSNTPLHREGSNTTSHTLPRTTMSLSTPPLPPEPHLSFPFYPPSANEQSGSSCWSEEGAITWLKKTEGQPTHTHRPIDINTFYMKFLTQLKENEPIFSTLLALPSPKPNVPLGPIAEALQLESFHYIQ